MASAGLGMQVEEKDKESIVEWRSMNREVAVYLQHLLHVKKTEPMSKVSRFPKKLPSE